MGFNEAREESSATGGARYAAASTTGGNPKKVLVIQDSMDPSEAKVFPGPRPAQRCKRNVRHLVLGNPSVVR